jgi:prepilin-type N-terminal cleavage/methylation domain-containing protein
LKHHTDHSGFLFPNEEYPIFYNLRRYNIFVHFAIVSKSALKILKIVFCYTYPMLPAELLPPPHSRSAFTLIELLVVIAIIAILSVVVILVLNPIQLLQQARDTNRISDMSTLNTALGVSQAQGGSSLGSSSVIYVSIPDPSATTTAGDQCQGLGFNPAPNGYSYACAASSTYRTTFGQGWIPISFSSLPAGSPLGQLPQDPVNTTSSREYYTYTTNGTQYEETSVPESSKYQIGGSNDIVSNDGGPLVSVYEKGSAYGLEPMDYGDSSLVGFWSFNEGTGTIAYDYSGNNATGSWMGSQVGNNNTYYGTGKGRGYQYAGDFDGNSTYINAGTTTPASTFQSQSFSVISYIYLNSSAGSGSLPILSKGIDGLDARLQFNISNDKVFFGFYGDDYTGSAVLSTGLWYQVAITWNATTKSKIIYVNGSLSAQSVSSGLLNVSAAAPLYLGYYNDGPPWFWNGLIDDVRIYNRALSAAQIAAMYAGGK